MKSIFQKIKKQYKSIIFKIKIIHLTRINTLLLLRNLYTIQHIFAPKKIIAALSIMTLAGSWIPVYNMTKAANTSKIVYPIQEMSELECRFQKFSELKSNCKRQLPILKTKDYKKYIKKDGWYNDYTRIYTVLWWSSYKYWWDVWNGWHGGTDIASAEWTPVYSIADGKVIGAKYMVWWGNNVSIEHLIDGKKVVSNYSHLSKIDIKNWAKVKAGTKIWEVWNTGNSFGNHLHFQIDLDTPFHPYYYDYSKCPYSYSQISESDVCFWELSKNTIDPLAFLESKGAILDKVKYISTALNDSKNQLISKNQTNSKNSSSKSLPTILYTYVHIDSEADEIKDLQEVFKDMWVYKWSRTWKYSDIKQTLIAYQIDRGVIENEDSIWAGYFWPKTRAQAQSDYREFLAGKDFDTPIKFTNSSFWSDSSSSSSKVENNIQVEKISRNEVLTREEIELRETREFRNNYQIDLQFDGTMGNIGLWQTENIRFFINKSNGRPFRGNTPGNITIETDENILKVFPNTFYSFTNWKRDIRITGLKKWVTQLKVKMWETELKSFKVNVFDEKITIVPKSWSVLSSKKIVFWEEKTWFVVMKDENNTNLINLKYEWKYILKSETDTKFCFKKTDIKNIRKSLQQKCNASDFKNEIHFWYDDTADGILVFDYKVGSKEAQIQVLNKVDQKQIAQKKLLVTQPKWLWSQYAYSTEVVNLLEKGIVDGISKWYFLEERELSQADAYNWIQNTLVSLKKSTESEGKKSQIQARIDKISKMKTSKYSYLSRRSFLETATDNLVFDDVVPEVTITYKDLNDTENQRANLVFDASNTWKDRFWENYYRPKEKISRGEWAYLISRVLQKKTSNFVTLK